jgi:hypothetical protein
MPRPVKMLFILHTEPVEAIVEVEEAKTGENIARSVVAIALATEL